MPDFILEYDILETIAKSSKSLGKEAKDYSESLQSKIVRGIDHVTSQSSGYLINASDLVSDKINALKLKSDAFYSFAEQISNLLIVAEQTDQEVADIIAAQREYFLDHHASLRIEDWKAKLLDLLVDVKNSILLLNLIANILKGLDSILEALADTVKHWYECGGGKYIINVVWSIGEVAFAIAGMVAAVTALATLAVPGAAFFAVCGIIGASIALVNGVTNVFTSCRGADAALDGNPALAVIYGKQDKLSDVLRQKNFGDGSLNTLSNLGAGALDLTETFCDIVGIAEIAGIAKLFQGNAFKQLKNGTLSFSDLKNGAKNGIVDLKINIKNGYADLKKGSRLDDVGGTVRSDIDLNISKGGLDSPADVAKSWQGSELYPGIDDYKNINLHKGDDIYILESDFEVINSKHSGYATTYDTVVESGFDSQDLSKGLQIKPYLDESAEEIADFAEYRSQVTKYTVDADKLQVAFGERTLANPQYGNGGKPQFFVNNIESEISSGTLVRGESYKLNNYKIGSDEYFKMITEARGKY